MPPPPSMTRTLRVPLVGRHRRRLDRGMASGRRSLRLAAFGGAPDGDQCPAHEGHDLGGEDQQPGRFRARRAPAALPGCQPGSWPLRLNASSMRQRRWYSAPKPCAGACVALRLVISTRVWPLGAGRIRGSAVFMRSCSEPSRAPQAPGGLIECLSGRCTGCALGVDGAERYTII